MLVLDGTGELMIGDRICKGGPGTLFLIPPMLVHECGYPRGSAYGRHLWCTVFQEFCRYSLCRVGDDGFSLDSAALRHYQHFDKDFIRGLRTAWAAAAQDGASPEHLEELVALIRLQNVRLIRIEREALVNKCFGSKQRYDRMVTMIKEYIGCRNGRDCSIKTLADISGYSRSRFLDIFRRYAGCTVMEYVNQQRIKRFKLFYRNTPVKLMADELGFGSTSSFIHWRKRNIPEAGK